MRYEFAEDSYKTVHFAGPM